MINLKSNTQTLVAIWSRTLGSIADTFVIFLEFSILINVWSIRSRTQKHSLLFEVGLRLYIADTFVKFLELSILIDIWSMWSWKHKRSLPFKVGLWGLLLTRLPVTLELSILIDISDDVYLMMTNVMMKTCLNQKIIKNSNLIQAMKSSVCSKPKVIRRPNFSESRICPNIYRMFRSVDWTQDMIIVKWHLFIWHERKLCALANAPPVQSTQMGEWLSTLFYANCSAAQVYVLHPRQFIFALSCRQRPFLQVLQSTEC